MTNLNTNQIVVGAIISILLLFFVSFLIKKIKESRSKHLRYLGYEYFIYFINNCNKREYYRDTHSHINNLFSTSYYEINNNIDRWYITKKSKAKLNDLLDFYKKASKFTTSITSYFSDTHYFAYSEYRTFISPSNELEGLAKKIIDVDFAIFVKVHLNDSSYLRLFRNKPFNLNLKNQREQHNNEFVQRELLKNEKYFDTLLDYPLDQQQRLSIVKLEDNCLVVSSAGSGKTSTSIAKVKYLLDKQKIDKEKILVLSYNRKTADEFQDKLNVKGLTCNTFHALAMSIIAKTEESRPDICEEAFLMKCFYNLVKKNDIFKANINKFFGEISSITKNEHYYDKAEDYYKDRETYGIMAPYGDMNGNPIYTKSEEEKKICTWLTTHSIDFLYEQPYPVHTADTKHRQYKPDFTIYFNKNGYSYCIFLEHFGIDANGNVPKWFALDEKDYHKANSKYNSDILWKRSLHKQNKTILIETTSALFHNNTIYEKLEKQLRTYGIIPKELTEDEKYEKLVTRNKEMEDNIKTLFSSFINLMKSNGKNFNSIMQSIKDSRFPIQPVWHPWFDRGRPKPAEQTDEFCERCKFLMYNLIKPLYEHYQESLQLSNQMDFTDLILHATELCNSGNYISPFEYIIVDEFQDISVDRYKFIQALRKENPHTKTFCVGDDWQSIYRFSGSDMNLFNHFESYFGHTERCKIETTYRFGNPLVKRSSKFILKNPAQVKKEVKPFSNDRTTQISFIPFSRLTKKDYLETIENLIKTIPKSQSIMLLARYNYDVKIFPDYCIKQSPNSKRAEVNYAGRKMNFMSVHASKGLEADNVIILNCSQDGGGFPSRISDDPILGYVLSDIDDFEYSEERRLFYVAITRAKKHTYVMYNNLMPSVFVNEMIEDDEENDNQILCPLCKKGKLKVVKVYRAQSGKCSCYYTLSCSNTIANCKYFKTEFFNSVEEIETRYKNLLDKYAKLFYSENIEEYIEKYCPKPKSNRPSWTNLDDMLM